MATNNKTRKIAVYPDGRRYVIRRANGMWWWGPDRASSHMEGVRYCLEVEHGGHIETEPNPNYRAPRQSLDIETLLSNVFGGR